MSVKLDREKILSSLKGGLIVSCQALEGEPLYRKEGGIMPLMARAAAMSGAKGIRANSVRDIKEIMNEVSSLPVIGIIKKEYEGSDIYITPTFAEVDALVECGVHIIAVQGTKGLRPNGVTAPDFIAQIKKKYPSQLIMADCAEFDEALSCADAGADFVGSTMRGYTEATRAVTEFDPDFISLLADKCPVPVIAEGRVHYPTQAKQAIDAGAFAVVVGGAITRPAEITARFVQELKN